MPDRELRRWKSLVRERADREWRELSLDVVDELACHLADLHAAALRGGSTEREARQAALDALNAASFLEVSKRPRARRGVGYGHDVRIALRQLVATPVVTAIAVLSLALGIGANTAIFSLVNSLSLRALPVKEPQRLAILDAQDNGSWTYPIFEELRRRSQLFDGIFAWDTQRFDLANGGITEFVDGAWATAGLFDTLGVSPIVGRTFTEADDVRGGGPDGPVAVIGYTFWQRRFGGAGDVIGKRLTLEGVPFTVVGVMPRGFFGPDVGHRLDVIVPVGMLTTVRPERSFEQRDYWWLSIMVRLKAGQSVDQATDAIRSLQPQIREATLPNRWPAADLVEYLRAPLTLAPAATGSSSLRQRYERPLLTIMVVVVLVLLIACANIANLLLARATARRHEWSVRLALGASRWRLVRLLLTESLLLSAIGAGVGLLVARWGSQLLVAQLSTQTNTVFLDLSVDWRVLAFTTGITVITAVLFGVAPAYRAAGVAPMEAIKEQGRSTGAGANRLSLANALVVVQVALSVILVVAAALFLRTFTKLARLDLGFEPSRVLVVKMSAERASIDNPAQRMAVYERARQAVAGLPGVQSAALSLVTPVSGNNWGNRLEVSGGVALTDSRRSALRNQVSPGFFDTYGQRLVAGRAFNNADRVGSPPVALVNQAFARRFLNGENPIGHTLRRFPAQPDEPSLEIVGVVGDAVYRRLRDPVPPTVYSSTTQSADVPTTEFNLSVRAAGSPALLTQSIADAIAVVNKDLALTFRPLSDQIGASLTQERIVAMLAGFFGTLALLLAGLGLYGVTSYAVSRRRNEIGIRMALGAAPAGVVRLVLSRVSMLVGLGVVIGAGISLWASPVVATLLYGLEPRDPATLASSIAVLAAVGAIAGWLPARRAARIDPAEVLRDS